MAFGSLPGPSDYAVRIILLDKEPALATVSGGEVVAALEAFRGTGGEYPEDLSQLVPQYLAEIPHTGMIAFKNFEYVRALRGATPSSREFELRIPCEGDDELIYWPSGAYPDAIGTRTIKRIGSWACLWE